MNDDLLKRVSPDKLREAERLRAKFAAEGMDLTLREILVKKGWLPREGDGTIPGFEILEVLGQGGMGVVYKARQTSMDRIVALKVLLPQYSRQQGFVDRFLREAKAVAKLNHPNIVGGYDAGDANGAHYTVMEFVEGETLDTRLAREKKLPWKEALRIVRQIGRALDHASAAGLVHRDIKPSNIILTADGTAKLLDLGMARASGEGEASLTLTGHVVGTPQYMSPEQASGDKALDVRTDLYALGITLYEMLTGAPPFTGSNPMAILHKHVHEGVRFAIPGVPPGVLTLGHRLTDRNRAKRYASAAELLADLDRVEEGGPPSTVSTRRVTVRRKAKTPLQIGIGAAAALVLIVVVILATRPSERSAPPKPVAKAVPPPAAVVAPAPAPKPEPRPDVKLPAPVAIQPGSFATPLVPAPPVHTPEAIVPVPPPPPPPPPPTSVPEPAPAEPARDVETADRAALEAFGAELAARAGRRDYEKIDAGAPPMESPEGRRLLAERLEPARLAREVWRGAREHIRGLQGKSTSFETRQGRKIAGVVEAVANDDHMYVKEKTYAAADLGTSSLAAFYAAARGPAARPEAVAAFALLEGDLALAEETLRKARATAPPGVAALLEAARARKAEEKEIEALLKAGRWEEILERHPRSTAAATAKERLEAKRAAERKTLFKWTFDAGVDGWAEGSWANGSLKGTPAESQWKVSSCGWFREIPLTWNPRYRLRFDYKFGETAELKVQLHPVGDDATRTRYLYVKNVEPGAWKTFDRSFGEFNSPKDMAPGERIRSFYILAGFGERPPNFWIDNVEFYDPGESKR